MANKNPNNKRTRFSSTNQPQKNGRKKNILTNIRLNTEYSISDIRKMIQEHLDMSRIELTNIVKDESTKGAKLIIASCVLKTAKNGDFKGVQQIFELLFGKEITKIDLTAQIESNKTIFIKALKGMTKDEIIQAYKELEDEKKYIDLE